MPDLFMLPTIAIAVVAALLVLGLVFFLIRRWIKVAGADEALVISGNKQQTQVVVSGRAIVNPITQQAKFLSLRSRQVSLSAKAQSADGVTLTVESVAIVKVGSDPTLVRRAAERFVSQDKAIEAFTTEQLEGALRGVVATLPVIDLMRDRGKFSNQIAADVATELADQGLVLDSFQIKDITDAVGYIESLGVPQVQAKRREAEIAQTNANRAIAERRIAAAEENLIEQTKLDQNTANAEAEVGKARAEARQAEALASTRAEQAVLDQRAKNREAELDAEVRRTADADRYRRQQAADADAYEAVKQAEAAAQVARAEAEAVKVRAEAEAEATRAQGEAKAAAIRAEAEALSQNQDAVLARQVVEILPEMVEHWARAYEKVGNITVYGGDASSHLGGESAAALASTFDTVRSATGLDIAGLLQGRMMGQGIGDALASGQGSSGQGATGQAAPAKQSATD